MSGVPKKANIKILVIHKAMRKTITNNAVEERGYCRMIHTVGRGP